MKLFLVPRSPCEKLLSPVSLTKQKYLIRMGENESERLNHFCNANENCWKIVLCPARTRTNVVAALPCKLAISIGNFHHSGSMNVRALFRAFACKWGELLRDERGRNHKRCVQSCDCLGGTWGRTATRNFVVSGPHLVVTLRTWTLSCYLFLKMIQVQERCGVTNFFFSNVFSPLVRFQNSKK